MLAPLVAIAYAFIALALPVFAAPAQSQDQAINTTNTGVPTAEDRQSSEAPKAIEVPAPATASETDSPMKSPEGDEASASKLQELISARLPKLIELPADRTAIEAFYRERAYRPLWTSNGAATPRARTVIAFLQNVTSEGLDPSDYPTPSFSANQSDENTAANEINLTRSVLTYARHASAGRVSFTRVSGSILYPSHSADPTQVLSQIASAENVQGIMLSFEPQQRGFTALKAKLAKEMAAPDLLSDAQQPDTDSPKLKQRRSKVPSAKTRAKAEVIGSITANMERWRWLPRDLGAAYVMVNIPDYSLGVFNDGSLVWTTKIVTGQPGEKATPLLSETMKYLTINPTWNVPPSIIRNEYLPALQRDPNALDRIGLKVGRNHDGSIRVYQPPGARNALGRIRFNFPNPFLVYQHDTPNKNLFARDTRALSHGCMRVQFPEKYAEVLLSISQPQDGMTVGRISQYFGDDERTIVLKRPIPVHVTYQTAFFDEAGHFETRDDVYGLDAAVLKLMRGGDRLIADTPIARNYESSSKPVMARLPSRSLASGRWDERLDRENRIAGAYDGYPIRSIFDRAGASW
jgi:murein L,D-transpeptidase YcbB/YkuD